MISAWDIYWVMQLDSISCVLTFAGIALFVIAAGCWAVGSLDKSSSRVFPEMEMSKREAESGQRLHAGAFRLMPWAIALLALNAFVPSTKTAAMMIVLPCIANNEAIQREAGDLYGIAKDALRNLAAPKQEPRK